MEEELSGYFEFLLYGARSNYELYQEALVRKEFLSASRFLARYSCCVSHIFLGVKCGLYILPFDLDFLSEL